MNIYCVDDSSLHLSRITKAVKAACVKKGYENAIIEECKDGEELMEALARVKPDLITLDINMPNMDGLSALAKLRFCKVFCKVIMVSSETEMVVKRLAKVNRFDAEDAKKKEMLNRVVERVRAGKVEEGKINSVLEACANLGMDPIDVATELGADDFLQKPYEIEDASKVILGHL